ncbi:MAG: DUF1488 family protein [Anderseniella sp.]|nr:DUF1488 family protein [Anderseniella sp.]
MAHLVFSDDERLFDGQCVRFKGCAAGKDVQCGVTVYALKHHCPELPVDGLLPGELFLEAYDRLASDIHHAARRKYEAGEFETGSPVMIMVHDHDFV